MTVKQLITAFVPHKTVLVLQGNILGYSSILIGRQFELSMTFLTKVI